MFPSAYGRTNAQSAAARLEGNVFVRNLGACATPTNRLFRSVGVEIVSATATARSAASASAGSHALTASAQHPEIVRHNLKARSLLSFFVLPFTRLNAAFDKNERALLQILLRNLRLFPPHDDLVPLRPLLP